MPVLSHINIPWLGGLNVVASSDALFTTVGNEGVTLRLHKVVSIGVSVAKLCFRFVCDRMTGIANFLITW